MSVSDALPAGGPMNIWIFNHYACLRHGSGLTSHAVMAQTLARDGHEVTIFPAAFAQAYAPAVEIEGRQKFVDQFEGDVRFRFVRTRAYGGSVGRMLNMLSYRRNVARCIKGFDRPDVIIGSLSHPHAVEAARQLSHRLGCRFVYEIRDIWPQSLIEMGGISRRHPIFWHFRALERLAFRHAHGVISVLPGIEKYAALHGVPPERVAYIPNGIDPELYPEPSQPPPIDSDKDERLVISCFTRFGSGNSMDTVIDAATLLQNDPNGRDILIRLVGDGPTRAGLEQRAADLGLDNVEFLDLVS
ncbi:MAG: glycosyltransferase family 4 protein, partial [Pirellulales bacterium]|nr:glycosyltransferase family 4 protein [Pirellulales bacterium]